MLCTNTKGAFVLRHLFPVVYGVHDIELKENIKDTEKFLDCDIICASVIGSLPLVEYTLLLPFKIWSRVLNQRINYISEM